MSAGVIIIDVLAVLAMIIGFHMVFRQKFVRSLLSRSAGAKPAKAPEDDPAHYALIIFGMMIFAFGLIIFGFVTSFALLT
jgi:Na+/H+ antiporter NhaD/arsenite permease-like protein